MLMKEILICLVFAILCIFGMNWASIKRSEHHCNEQYYLEIIKAQQKQIDKYTGYANWFRELHGIDTTKMEQFKHGK